MVPAHKFTKIYVLTQIKFAAHENNQWMPQSLDANAVPKRLDSDCGHAMPFFRETVLVKMKQKSAHVGNRENA